MKTQIKFNKINIWQIIKKHFKTLVNHNTNKAGYDEWTTFLWLPAFVSALIVLFNGSVSNNTVNLIITALSIFVGLLINVLVLIFSLIQKETNRDIKIIILEETIINISYSIVISILTIILSFLVFIENQIVQDIASYIIYFLIIHFLFTLIMIVKRMFLLFFNELDEFKRSGKYEHKD